MTVGDTRRYFTADDWENAREFVALGRRSTLTLELLAGAEYLAKLAKIARLLQKWCPPSKLQLAHLRGHRMLTTCTMSGYVRS